MANSAAESKGIRNSDGSCVRERGPLQKAPAQQVLELAERTSAQSDLAREPICISFGSHDKSDPEKEDLPKSSPAGGAVSPNASDAIRNSRSGRRSEKGSAWALCCMSCRPSHSEGYELAQCSFTCTCAWCLLPCRLAGSLCTASYTGYLADHPYPEWNCLYYIQFRLLQLLASAAPRGNLYALQAVTQVPFPTWLLPRGVRIRKVSDGAVCGEWLEPSTPEVPVKTVLYFHGGAFVLCKARTERMIIANLLKALGRCRIFAADYAKPPAQQHPAALLSALESWRWLTQKAGIRPKDIVIGGDSAGGNLALALLLNLQSLGEEMPSGGLLLSPWVELLPFESESWKNSAKHDYIAHRDLVVEFATLYAGDASPRDPLVAPLHASPEQLHSLPPLWVSIGGAEVLRSSIEDFVARARSAGVSVQVYLGAGMPHVYQLCYLAFPPPRSGQLPKCCCCGFCCRECVPTGPPEQGQRLHPVWDSLEDARRFVWSQEVWGDPSDELTERSEMLFPHSEKLCNLC
ncbi:unnamed protein product [Polarella glacialis]|uniref:Alpha/beta hydrolase fold-3 domain-containing protein n=1 Tax=Polarella glacialis TaxID=89957 RepID=A0A813I9W9_POLGL|nr:unnamed protein product [Polarella glacialis]